jgi:hypothetical protein
MTRAAALLAILLTRATSLADPAPTTAVDCTANPKLYETHFGRYGPRAAQVVTRDPRGLRLSLPADPKGAKQAGLYSYFALAGDFEVVADYEVLNVPPPAAGYGTGFGIAVEARGADGDVCVRRGAWKFEGEGIQLVRGTPVDGEMKYETQFVATKAKTGRLVLRREKADLVLLTADQKAEPAERFRVPFTAGTVRTVRLYADCGGSATPVDGRVTSFRVKAEEMTGGIPERERDPVAWWVYAAAAAVAVVAAVGLHRALRRKHRRDRA